jgi:hypothetical protein
MVGTLQAYVLTTPVETVSNLEGQMAVNLILPAEDIVAEEDIPGKAMVAMAMVTAKAPPHENIIFNWWQSCPPYWINP